MLSYLFFLLSPSCFLLSYLLFLPSSVFFLISFFFFLPSFSCFAQKRPKSRYQRESCRAFLHFSQKHFRNHNNAPPPAAKLMSFQNKHKSNFAIALRFVLFTFWPLRFRPAYRRHRRFWNPHRSPEDLSGVRRPEHLQIIPDCCHTYRASMCLNSRQQLRRAESIQKQVCRGKQNEYNHDPQTLLCVW